MVETSSEANHAYASWLSRAGATILDGLILAIPYAIGIGVAVAGDEAGIDALLVIGVILIVGSVLAPFVYFPVMHSRESGQTWGKRAAGIRVRTVDGGRLSGGRAFARYAIQVVFGILFYVPLVLDYLWPLWDARSQSLHDKVAESVVVRA